MDYVDWLLQGYTTDCDKGIHAECDVAKMCNSMGFESQFWYFQIKAKEINSTNCELNSEGARV